MDPFEVKFLRHEFERLHERLDAIERKIDQLGAPSPGTDDSSRLIGHLINGGYKLQAIKAYQEATGSELSIAEAYVDRIASQIAAAKRKNES